MFAVNEISPGVQQSSATQLQMQLIASQSQTQRVAALTAGDQSGDAGMNTSAGRPDSSKLLREAIQKSGMQREAKTRASDLTTQQKTEQKSEQFSEAAARSIIEAQEQSQTATAITAAFQARYAITDLLSVIRDPEDQMLPMAPKDHAA